MKQFIVFFILLFSLIFVCQYQSYAQEQDYIEYHNKIIEAEKIIFLQNNIDKGLLLFDSIFKNYDFVFIDDCLEAFQLGLFWHKDTLAYKFLKKAIENGFHLNSLKSLRIGFLCDNYETINNRSYSDSLFFRKFEDSLNNIQCSNSHIDTQLLQVLIKRHMKEQSLKQNIARDLDIDRVRKLYLKTNQNNVDFLISLLKNNKFWGERNIGIYTDIELEHNFQNIQTVSTVLHNYLLANNLDLNTYSPVLRDDDILHGNILFIILFHHENSYSLLKPYIDNGIRKGYFHPREIAILLQNDPRYKKSEYSKLNVTNFCEFIDNTVGINKLREELYLPPYEVDYHKMLFSKKNNLKLCFGFRNTSN